MKSIGAPTSLATILTELFPSFAVELEGKEIATYHQIVQLLAPMITRYLQEAPKGTPERFCDLVNEMVSAGGEQENAISTCLLEHSSQIEVKRIIRPYLSPLAKKELR